MVKVEIDLGTPTNSCFVIMPFDPTFQTEYDRIIRPAVEDAGLISIRADEIYSKPHIMGDIWKALRCGRIVIAELTSRNTNVFYEVGLAHALGKPVIIITRNENDVPFDLKALRYLYYNTDDPFWGQNLRKALTNMLKNLLKEEQYGTVFEGIATKGEIKFEEEKIIPKKAKVEPSHNITGVWQGFMKIGEDSYNCNLSLFQRGDKLSGTMTVSYVEKDELSVVKQVMTGEIHGDAVTLYGVSYSFVRQGASKEYLLDSLLVKTSSKGNKMSGMCDDEEGHKGEISLIKENI